MCLAPFATALSTGAGVLSAARGFGEVVTPAALALVELAFETLVPLDEQKAVHTSLYDALAPPILNAPNPTSKFWFVY